jgi:membrane-bound metal-dependent hydrolase YbcI (DUF457 family)
LWSGAVASLVNKRGHVLNAVLLSVGLGYVLHPAGDAETVLTILEVGVPVTLGALFPDVDTEFGRHRKALHNLAVLAGFVAFPYYFGNLQWVWLGVLTHYVLDVVGSKRGIALFYPVWSKEFNLPTGVAVSSDHADLATLAVTALELVAAWLIVNRIDQVALEYGGQLIA